MDRGRLSSLDSCRGLAILLVIGFHTSITYPPAIWVSRLTELGNIGVQLFFLVSAVTMCHMWEQRRDESHRVLKFYIRRFFRIAPLFWFAIAFYTLLWHTSPGLQSLDGITRFQILITALFLHPFVASAINAVVPGGWSIGIEMGFYFIFPIIARLPRNRLLMFALAMYLSLGLIGTTLAERFGSGEQYAVFLYYSFLTQLPIFPIGMYVYALTHREVTAGLLQTYVIVVVWLLLAITAKLEFHLTTRPVFWIEITLLATFVGCLIRWNLGSSLLAFLGRLSYSMYLFHFAVLYFLERLFGNGWPYLIGLAVTLGSTVAIAVVSQATAEKWSQDAARRLIAILQRRSLRRVSPS